MAEMSGLYFNIDVSEALGILDLSQLTALLKECRSELERRVADERKDL